MMIDHHGLAKAEVISNMIEIAGIKVVEAGVGTETPKDIPKQPVGVGMTLMTAVDALGIMTRIIVRLLVWVTVREDLITMVVARIKEEDMEIPTDALEVLVGTLEVTVMDTVVPRIPMGGIMSPIMTGDDREVGMAILRVIPKRPVRDGQTVTDYSPDIYSGYS
jgi:hypothetical protein